MSIILAPRFVFHLFLRRDVLHPFNALAINCVCTHENGTGWRTLLCLPFFSSSLSLLSILRLKITETNNKIIENNYVHQRAQQSASACLPACSIMNGKSKRIQCANKRHGLDVSVETLKFQLHGDRKRWWKLNYHLRGVKMQFLVQIKHKLFRYSSENIAINSPQAGNVSMERFTLTVPANSIGETKHITHLIHGLWLNVKSMENNYTRERITRRRRRRFCWWCFISTSKTNN